MPFEFHLPSLEDIRGTPEGLEMLRMIDADDFRSALISGCPGSGKTTVSIYRLVRINNQGGSVRLLTFQNMLVLAIKNLANVQRVPGGRVSTFHEWYRTHTSTYFNTDAPPTVQEIRDLLDKSTLKVRQDTEIIMDEGQDLPPCVHQAIPNYFQRVFTGADDGQQVHPRHGAKIQDIECALHDNFAPYRRYTLGRNFRNTFETYRFARQFAPPTNLIAWDPNILQRLQFARRHGPNPRVVTYNNVAQRDAHLRTVLENADGNVAILCPTCAMVDALHVKVKGMGLPVSRYHSKTGIPNPLERYLVTTYKSAKGMEFDVVVIPRINFFASISNQLYVASTRARRQLVVYRESGSGDPDPTTRFKEDTFDHETLGLVPTPDTTNPLF